jgi:hypothetical protein
MKYVSKNADNLPRVVKAGEYLLTVIEAIETVSKNSGDEMIKLHLEVEGHGCRLFDYLVASESSAWKLDTFRKAIGEAVVEGEEVELHAARLVGRRGYARLKVETYQGKDSNKVEFWLTDPPAGAAHSAARNPTSDLSPLTSGSATSTAGKSAKDPF